MKIHKFADKKREYIAIGIVALLILLVSAYVVYLVNHLTGKVYKVFGRSTDSSAAFPHFNFKEFDDLKLRPEKATSSSGVTPASTTPVSSASSS